MTPTVALDGIVLAAHTGAPLAPATVRAMSSIASEPLTADTKWEMWRDLTDGSSVSAAFTALKESGLLAHFPELAAVDGVEQDAIWHPEGDVLTHLGLTGDHMAYQCTEAGITGDERMILVLAASLHDLGKATHTQHHSDGKITSYGHDDAGVAPTHRFLASMDAPQRFHDTLEPLIKEHMCAVNAKGKAPSVTVVARLQRRLAPATIDQWVRVVNADHGGRGAASTEGYADHWLEVAKRVQEHEQNAPKRPGIVNGQHLIAAGLTPGPGFRAVLDAAAHAEADGVIVDGETARTWLADYLPSSDDR